jgi:hypothetical protein
LYRAYFVPNAIDPSGKITIVPLGDNFEEKACGEIVAIHWDFKLDNPAPCNGWIVQKISYSCLSLDCEDCFGDDLPEPRKARFWEAWRVTEGQVYPEKRLDENGNLIPPFQKVPDKLSTTDASSHKFPNGTCGYKWSLGEVRFYCEISSNDASGTGRLDLRWSEGVGLYWPKGCGKISGGLPATQDPPIFWTNHLPIEGPAFRYSAFDWVCCPGECGAIDYTSANGLPRE